MSRLQGFEQDQEVSEVKDQIVRRGLSESLEEFATRITGCRKTALKRLDEFRASWRLQGLRLLFATSVSGVPWEQLVPIVTSREAQGCRVAPNIAVPVTIVWDG